MKTTKIRNVKELKDFIKDLPDSFPVGTYCPNYWIPTMKEGQDMSITEKGLAVEIEYSSNY